MKQLLNFALLSLISASLTYGGSIQGVIRDAQTQTPIDSVKVTVHVLKPDSVAFPTTTDQNGMYSITGIIPDNEIYVVVTHRNGYIYSYTRIDNLGSLDMIYNIFLTPDATTSPGEGGSSTPSGEIDSSTVSGTIMASSIQNGTFVPIANVQIGLTSGDRHLDVITNSDGKYAANIPLGRYSISISANGYKNLTINGVLVESSGATVNAILKSIGTGINTDLEQSKPDRFTLSDAYPNPFNPSTTIQFSLPERRWATLKVYNTLGHEVAVLAAGEFEGDVKYRVTFNASNLASGVYFSRLEFMNKSVVKKLVLVK